MSVSAALITDSPGTDLDQIAQQLRAEIKSLEDHIQRTSDRFLATQWASELVDPFEQLESDLDTNALQEAVQAMYIARARFKVNGHLAERIDAILERHASLIEKLEDPVDESSYDDVVHETPEPANLGTDSLFEDEEDSIPEGINFGVDEIPAEGGSVVFSGDNEIPPDTLPSFTGDDQIDSTARVVNFVGADDVEDNAKVISFPGESDEEEAASVVAFSGELEGETPGLIDFGRDDDTEEEETGSVDFGRDAEIADIPHPTFSEDADAIDSPPPAPFDMPGEEQSEDEGIFDGALSAEDSDALFDTSANVPVNDAGSAANTDDLFGAEKNDAPSPPTDDGHLKGAQDKRRAAAQREKQASEEELFAIFSHKVSVDDLLAALDITIPPEDIRALENQLRARLSDRVVNALRSTKLAAGQYVLLPRIPRFVDNGKVVPCTVKNLARRFHKRFGDIRDLMRYRNDPMMASEIPEPGWALITPESPRESLGKNYMEQNQYLRYLATSLTIPSHLLRRRTMVEGIYDLIVGGMVLGKQFQQQSLDWTSSSPTKNDYVCVYTAPEGIRVRDLSRTTHHPSLGVCPNW